MNAYEVNFDGIVGPTHNYAGLSFGNIASIEHRQYLSNPKEAALQGLEKMKLMADMGVVQAVFPPQIRPDLTVLRAIGFTGSDAAVIIAAYKKVPKLFSEVCSASTMWAANAATVSPSADSTDGKVHFTPANLASTFHRSIEAQATSKMLRAIFNHDRYFSHHAPLPGGCQFSDEGAANHTRFCRTYGEKGVQLFVYGRKHFDSKLATPERYPARQSLEASQAIARLHNLSNDGVVFAQQNPAAIDAGAFHNDVVAVGNQHLFFYHALAFADKQPLLDELSAKTEGLIKFIEVSQNEISIEEAVNTYLFNSQIVTLTDASMTILAPRECEENPHTHAFLQNLVTLPKMPIRRVKYINLRQSMMNGGGPACLRLRVALTREELGAIAQGVILNNELYNALKDWINKYYRDRLAPADLADPLLYEENLRALNALSRILRIGPF